ncbi:uncharacterized protein LOC121405258 [Drosophila obscura]|uniref:uncharacterized protein LOC121405258 n=1 Tax=Drosophila obscura TaxID=7282 RepID=UPI001BB11CA2|nr:uncharacterized protein LOC121405258 [Drosophila obscura]
MVPLDLLADERQSEMAVASVRREGSIALWQRRWDQAKKGSWTRRLIPQLSPEGEARSTTNGLGCLKRYLQRFKHADDPYCIYCGPGVDEEEDDEHVFLHFSFLADSPKS